MDPVIDAIRTGNGSRHGPDRRHDSVKYVSRPSLHPIYKNRVFWWTIIDWWSIISSIILDLTIVESHRTRCCTFDGQIISEAKTMPQCFPMLVPHDDPVYSKFLVRCLNFVRSMTDIDRGCSSLNKPAEQVRSCISFICGYIMPWDIVMRESYLKRPYPRRESRTWHRNYS